MKNITSSFKNITIKSVLIALLLIFNIHNSFSQVDLRTCGFACTSNNYTLTDVYLSLSDVNGDPITNTTCTIGQVQPVYIYLNYSSNSNSSIHFTRLNSDLTIDGVTTFLNVLMGDVVPGSNKKLIYGPFNWVCGQELSLSNTIIAWKTNSNNDPGANYNCGSFTNSQCDFTNSFTISKPLAVQFTYKACKVGANTTVVFNSTTNGGKTPYTYAWDFKNDGGVPDSTIANPTYTYTTSNNTAKLTVTDSQGISNFYILPIIEPDELMINGSPSSIGCNGGTSTITLNVTGGTGAYTYLWNNGVTSKDLVNVTPGTYNVTVTDANGCTKTQSFTINQPTTLTATTSQTDVSCNGGTNGTATVTVSGGSPTYTYAWSPSGGTAATASGLGIGTYTVTVTDANGCTLNKTFTITQPSALIATAGSQTNVSCNTGTNGSATVSVVGGTGTYTYLWSPSGGTAATASGLAAGTYTVTVKDANLCQTTQSFTITEPAVLSATTSQTNVSCNGGSNGTASVVVSGGTSGYTYSWAPSGGTAATATGLAEGTYTVTITDSKSCTLTKTFTITQPAVLAATTSQTNVSCNGGTNGSAGVVVSGGTSGYTYSWAPSGGTASVATGLAQGTYTVTITDNKGCTLTKTFTITQPDALDATTSQTNVSCNGGSNGSAGVVVSGGTAGYTYLWSPSGGTAATATGLTQGTYSVTITDANTCTLTKTFTITQPTVLTASITKIDVSCNGGSNGSAGVTASGGTPGYTYSWSPSGGTAATATGLIQGTYTVTITDSKGCTLTKTFNITQPNVLAATTSQTNVSCNGGTNGSAGVVVSGGTSGYTYLWSPSGGSAATATGLAEGNYTVTITDANSCTLTKNFTITQPDILDATTSQTNVSCNGGSNGSAGVVASGGTPGYTYLWSPSGGTAATATGLTQGSYTVTITDSKGCTLTKTFNITQPNVLAATTSQTNVSCNGGTNGSAGVVVSGGTPGYTYSWSPSGGTASIATGLTQGSYTVTITDSKGCMLTKNFTITQPNVLAATASQINVSCNGGSNGSASVVVSGGTAGYTYLWSPSGGTAATATALSMGNYFVTITDANTCTLTQSFTITEPNPLTATTSQINVGCGGGNTGTATVIPSGGTPGYTYLWSPSGGTGATANNLTAGTYTVIVTDNKQCTVTKTVIILDGDSVKPIIDPLPITSTINCPAVPIFAQATATDDNGTISSLTYQDTTIQGNCAGSYTKTRIWTAKDACGNTSLPVSQTIIVQDVTAPTWTTQTASLDRTVECSSPQALASAQALFPAATDLCDTNVTNITKISGSFVAVQGCSNAGTYTNTWTVSDDCGNVSDTFTQVITIEDTVPPTWTTTIASLNVTLECSDTTGLASAQASFPVASDLCDTDLADIQKISGQFAASSGCTNAGTYTNTWTVKDDCGNISDVFTQVITIEDTTAPTWTTQTASLDQTIECSNTQALASAQALFPTASDLCDSNVGNIVKVNGQFVASQTCSNAGTYTNTWTVKDDCGNTSDTFTQIITIQDTTDPIFTGDLPQNITVSCDAVPEPATVEASDNCNGNLPIVFSEIKSGIQNGCSTNYTLTRTWTTSDCGGNTASYTQIIKVEDTTAPTGTAPIDVANLQNIADIPVGSPSDITDEADNCSQDINITVSDSNNGASGCEGNAYILTRTYTLTDCAGNKTELKQTFTVENKVAVSGVVSNVTCFGEKDGSILVTNTPGSIVVITNDKNEVVGNTNLPAGTYTLTATSSVNNNNQTCTATATVIITEPNYRIKVSGQIINVDTNTPIANVPVTLIPQGTTTGPILFRLTGADGMYTFSGMAAGSYLVQVQDANLNSVYELYPVDSSLFFTTLEDCKFQVHNFEYGKSKLPVLGDYVWYDTNANGVQDEWYDANNDGVVTKNIPDSEGAIEYSLWEWIDFNSDGSYAGPQNVGELNAGGFGNAKSSNVIVDGPNGYHQEVIIGIQGYWRDRPESANPYGQYKVKLLRDTNLETVAIALGVGGLVKVLPSVTDKKATSKTSKAQLHTVCTTTPDAGYIVNVTSEDLVHLDIDFGVNCKEYQDIVANDDSAGPIAGVNHTTTNVLNVLPNDTIEGVPVTASAMIVTTVTPNEFLQLNPDGSVDVLPNAPVGTLTMVYQICEADQSSNCDTATVTITIVAPVMTVTATPICVNDVPYLDYVVTPGNFTPVDGVTISWAGNNNTVISTMNNLPLSGRVLWPGAVVDQAGNGVDWPGWLFQNNQWVQGADGFETLRPTATLTISVNPSQTIVVNYPPADPFCIARPTFAIVANDDNAGPVSGNNGGTNVLNVYTNDTLNGNVLNPADVTLTTVTPDPKGALTLNPDGSVNVAPNTPTGSYVLTYQICENADFGNCDTATVTVNVIFIPPVVTAFADTYSVTCNGFGPVGNILSNDRIDVGPAAIDLLTLTILPSSQGNAGITVDALGNVNVASTTPPGTYSYDYQICLKKFPEICVTRSISVAVLPTVSNLSSEACADDSTLINLLSLLPENTPINGTWVDTNTSNALQGSILNPFGLALGSYVFEYKIGDPNCPRSIFLTMEINDDCKVLPCGNIVVHNAFSPNGDGINDLFAIDSIDETTCYPENTVEIYNRWGILVFETANYNNTTNAFDGTSRGRTTVKKSDGLPTGTYFYIITYKSLDGNNVMQNNKKDGYLYLSK